MSAKSALKTAVKGYNTGLVAVRSDEPIDILINFNYKTLIIDNATSYILNLKKLIYMALTTIFITLIGAYLYRIVRILMVCK